MFAENKTQGSSGTTAASVSIDNKIRCTLQLCLDSREHQRSVLQIHFILMYPAAVLDYAPEHLHSVL